jgi:hypothetical protein
MLITNNPLSNQYKIISIQDIKIISIYFLVEVPEGAIVLCLVAVVSEVPIRDSISCKCSNGSSNISLVLSFNSILRLILSLNFFTASK